MIAATCISPLILGLASFNVVTGAAINAVKNPEVIPGAGLPTLKELSITSDDLYKIGRPDSCMIETFNMSKAYYMLTTIAFKTFSSDESVITSSIQARFEPKCGPSDSAYVNVNEIIACYNYLKKLGNQNCVAPSGLGIAHFCYAGAAEVSGQSINPNGSSSYW